MTHLHQDTDFPVQFIVPLTFMPKEDGMNDLQI